jgi:hypothetical protein
MELPSLDRRSADLMLARMIEPIVIRAIGPNFDRQLLLPQWRAPKTPRPSPMLRAMREWLTGKACMVCGGTRKLQCHHMLVYHIWPQWGEEPRLWRPLCRGNAQIDCHCAAGHAGILEGICLYTDEFAGFLSTTRALNSEFVRLVRQVQR